MESLVSAELLIVRNSGMMMNPSFVHLRCNQCSVVGRPVPCKKYGTRPASYLLDSTFLITFLFSYRSLRESRKFHHRPFSPAPYYEWWKDRQSRVPSGIPEENGRSMTTLGRVGAPLTVVHPSQNSGRAASPVQAIEQASHDVISECRYTFCIARNSIQLSFHPSGHDSS